MWRGLAAACLVMCLLTMACYGCSGSESETLVLEPEVEAAMEAALDPEQTFASQTVSGAVSDLWDAMPTSFEPLDALLSGTGDTAVALAKVFEGTPTQEEDAVLCIYAYALAALGGSDATEVLESFLRENISGDLLLAPHMVARALVTLTGADDPSDGSYWYTGQELGELVGVESQDSALSMKADALGGGRSSCSRQFVLVDSGGTPLEYYDYNGVKRKAVVSGRLKASDVMTEAYAQTYKDKVAAGGGTYVNDNSEFPGKPTPQFNCAGYVTRGFNGGKKWNGDPMRWFRVLMGTESIVPVAEGDIRQGDLVFYFRSQSKGPGHVAEVQRVTTRRDRRSGSSVDITVRNGDGMSGLWEANIDAPYFLGKGGVGEIKGDYERREVYRWKDGQLPIFVPDPTFEKNSDNCDYVAPVTCDGCAGGTYGTLYLGTTPSGDLTKYNAGLYSIRADDGFTTLITQQAVEGLAVSWDSQLLAAGMVSGTGVLSGDAGIKVIDISEGGLAPLDPIFVLYEGDSPSDLTGPTWRMDNHTLVISRVGDLHLYDIDASQGSLKIWRGWTPAAAPDSSLLVVESSTGLQGLVDASLTAWVDYDPWDIEDGWMTALEDNPGNQFTIGGTNGDSFKPKFCKGGDQSELIYLDRTNRTVVKVATLSSMGSGSSSTSVAGPGGKIGAATCSPDGANIAVAVTESESAGGGVWIIPRSNPTSPRRLLKADFSSIWYIDLGWAY